MRLGGNARSCISKIDNLCNGPYMLTNPRFHGRSNSESLMNAHEVIPHIEEGDHMDVILNLLTECVVQLHYGM